MNMDKKTYAVRRGARAPLPGAEELPARVFGGRRHLPCGTGAESDLDDGVQNGYG